MTGVVTCAHDWQRETDSKSPTDVTLTCRRCGASSVAKGKVRGKTVTASLEMYPPRGTTMLDPSLYEFFIRQWEANITALTHSGFMVERRPPVVYTQTRSGRGGGSPDRKTSRFATGRDILLASAIVLIAGSLMLSAGIYIDGLEWLRLAGGISLGVLFFLLLLVVFLSS
jgi:hypothetical protein